MAGFQDASGGGLGSSVSFSELEGAAVITSAETIAANNNDTSIPTSAAVKAYADGATATLTNKTLTAPKFADGGFIADASGNEQLAFDSNASAVNYVEIANAATGTAVHIHARGDDANVGIHIGAKAAGYVNIEDGTDETKRLRFDLSGATTGKIATLTSSHTDNRTITLPDATDTLVGRATTDTLTNKTLTSPKVGTAILDTNGNELIKVTATASAVNELSIINGASGTGPELTVSGSDTTGAGLNLKLSSKAAGAAGAGGAIEMNAGAGDTAAGGAVTITGGAGGAGNNGGSIQVNGGTAGTGGGYGGSVDITAAAGSDVITGSAGIGGHAYITGGNGGSTQDAVANGAYGGDIRFYAGIGGSSALTAGGNGGNVLIYPGDAGGGPGGASNGGAVEIQQSVGQGGGTDGYVIIRSANGGDGSGATLRLEEPYGLGPRKYTAFTTQNQADNVTYILPGADGSPGDVLSTNGTGTLSWYTLPTPPVEFTWGYSLSGTSGSGLTLTLGATSDDAAAALSLSANNTQSNQPVLADLAIGTSTNVMGLLVRGTGSTTGGAAGTGKNHVTLWGSTNSNANKVLSIGNGVAFAETLSITADGKIAQAVPTTSGTSYSITLPASMSASAIGQSITGNNTQTNGICLQDLEIGTSGNVLGLMVKGTGSSTAGAIGTGKIHASLWANVNSSTSKVLSIANGSSYTENASVLADGTATFKGLTVGTSGVTLQENASIALDPAGSADGKYTGTTITATAGYTQAFGDLVYLDPTDSRWEATDANSAAAADGDSRGIIGMVVSAGTDGTACTILLNGVIRADAKFPTFTVNNPVYVSETAGAVTQTAPTTTDAVVRVVGYAITADEMYFNPASGYQTAV